MKKVLAFVLSSAMILALFASCGTNATPTTPDSLPTESAASTAATEAALPEVSRTNSTTAIMPAVVTVDAGSVMGYEDNGVYIFKGIPYGSAGRFEQPQKVEPWFGTLNCLTYGPVSPQTITRSASSNWASLFAFATPSGSDMYSNEANCLNLNVWTDSLETNAKKPVLVFFHGGGLETGSANELVTYDGYGFADYTDCVFVSVNARLNCVGYLDVSAYGGEEYANSSNAGIADMVLSLEWVRDNIAQFGGDPSNVTIMGQSGGGAKVTALASVPSAVGLFDKVVIASGGFYSRTQESAQESTAKLVEYLGLNPETDDVIGSLKAMSYDELADACTAAGTDTGIVVGGDYLPYAWCDSETGKLNEYAAQRSYMIGSTFQEFTFPNYGFVLMGMPSATKPAMTEEDVENYISMRFGENAEAAKSAFLSAYPDHDVVDVLLLNTIGTSGGDTTIAAQSGATVYNYMVSYEFPYFGGFAMGHTCDIPFWFHSLDTIPYQIAGDEETANKVSDEMASALAAFCATGNPSTAALKWTASTVDSPMTMVFDINSQCREASYDDAIQEILMLPTE